MEPCSSGSVQQKGNRYDPGGSQWKNKREHAHDIAEEGLDKLIEGNKDTGEKLTDQAKKIDPKGVEELAEEVERDKQNAERFVNKARSSASAFVPRLRAVAPLSSQKQLDLVPLVIG